MASERPPPPATVVGVASPPSPPPAPPASSEADGADGAAAAASAAAAAAVPLDDMDVDAFLARTAELESANSDLFAAMATVISKSRKAPPTSPGESSAGAAGGDSGGAGGAAAASPSAAGAATPAAAPTAASAGVDDDTATDGSGGQKATVSARGGGDTTPTASLASRPSTKEWSPATVAQLTSHVAAGRERLGLDGGSGASASAAPCGAVSGTAAADTQSLGGGGGGGGSGGAPPSAQKQVPKQAEFVNQLTTDVVAHARHVAAEHLRLRAAVAELQTENARMRVQSHRKGRRV